MRVDEPSGHRNRRDPLRRLLLHQATVCYELPTAGRSARCSNRRMADPNSATQAAVAWERANRVRAVLNSATPVAERPARCLLLGLRVRAPRIAARQVRAPRAKRRVRHGLSSVNFLGCPGDCLVVGFPGGFSSDRRANRSASKRRASGCATFNPRRISCFSPGWLVRSLSHAMLSWGV